MGKKRTAFTDVTFESEYPRDSVAEHEVFMSFNNDGDALAFREWWDEKGAVLFQEFLSNPSTIHEQE